MYTHNWLQTSATADLLQVIAAMVLLSGSLFSLYYAYSRIFAASFLMASIFAASIVLHTILGIVSPAVSTLVANLFLDSSVLFLPKLLAILLINLVIAPLAAKRAIFELNEVTSFERSLILLHKDKIKEVFKGVLREDKSPAFD